jgi:hypothetical protein
MFAGAVVAPTNHNDRIKAEMRGVQIAQQQGLQGD